MKTTSNINRIAKASIVSMTFVLALAIAPVQASSENTAKSVKNEIQAAAARLDAHNLEIENAIRFYAPAVSEDMEAYFETEAAEMRLDEVFNGSENAAVYVAPAVNENTEDLEVAEALENLEKMSFLVEQSIRFTAPEISE